MLQLQTVVTTTPAWPHAGMSLNDVLSFIGKASKHNLRAIEIATELKKKNQLSVENFINQVLPLLPERGWFYYLGRALKNQFFYRLKFRITDLPAPLFQTAIKLICGKQVQFINEVYSASGKPVKFIIDYGNGKMVTEKDVYFRRRSFFFFEMYVNGNCTYCGYDVSVNKID